MIYCQKLVSSLDVAEAKQFTVQDFQTVNLGSLVFRIFKDLFELYLLDCTWLTVLKKTQYVKNLAQSFYVCVQWQQTMTALVMFDLRLLCVYFSYFQA